MTYQDIADRLTPEARELFKDIVQAHLVGSGRREFMYSATLAGDDIQLAGSPGWIKKNPDPVALRDLVDYRVLRIARRGRQGVLWYQVPGEGIRFHKWLMEQEGSPIEQTEVEAMRLVEGDQFAKRHPGAAKHIAEALALLRTAEAVTDQVASSIGGHLRNAVFDLASEFTPDSADSERPIPDLEKLVAEADVTKRERRVLGSLVALVAAVLSLDNRLTHVRDEKDSEKPLRGWDEVRRAVFTTVFVCAELDRAMPHE